jgi:hypothetical protein
VVRRRVRRRNVPVLVKVGFVALVEEVPVPQRILFQLSCCVPDEVPCTRRHHFISSFWQTNQNRSADAHVIREVTECLSTARGNQHIQHVHVCARARQQHHWHVRCADVRWRHAWM